jgi:hypothetical protein
VGLHRQAADLWHRVAHSADAEELTKLRRGWEALLGDGGAAH